MKCRILALAAFVCGCAVAQQDLPKLARFDPSWIDKSKDPCTDFYQYTCSKWIAANPIPPDLPSTSVFLPLYLYNQTILRNAMEAAAANKQATGSERQIGDFWQSCMDESGRSAHGKEWLAAALKPIDDLRTRKDLTRAVAYVHLNFATAWQSNDNEARAPLFGYGPEQDLEDASKMVASIDQGGMTLPAIDYYVDKSEHF